MPDDTKVPIAAAIIAWLHAAPAPAARAAIIRGVGGSAPAARTAITALLADPSSGLVEVGPDERGFYRIATLELAARTGLHARERPGADPLDELEIEIDMSDDADPVAAADAAADLPGAPQAEPDDHERCGDCGELRRRGEDPCSWCAYYCS